MLQFINSTISIYLIIFLYFMELIILIFLIFKLKTVKKDLQIEKKANSSLLLLYDEIKGFQHDLKNIISSIDGYTNIGDISGLKKYINSVKKDFDITNSLPLLNPQDINNPGIYSLLDSKYFKAVNLGIKFELFLDLDFSSLEINDYKFSRILGILLDNAIEEAEKCDNKLITVSFKREENNHRSVILIENTYINKDVNIDNIFEKGVSGKSNHSGIGLWEIKKYVSNSKNLDLYTSKTENFFRQEFYIYDVKNKIENII